MERKPKTDEQLKAIHREADTQRLLAECALADIDEALHWGDITTEQAEQAYVQVCRQYTEHPHPSAS